MKKLSTAAIIVAMAFYAIAGTVNLAWDATPDTSVGSYSVYALSGTNAVFAAGNTNALRKVTVPVGTTTATFTNLPPGAWSFVATGVSTNGLESDNSNEIWCNVYPFSIVNLRVSSTIPPQKP